MPSIVQPAGVVTASFSNAGWSPVSSTCFAAPSSICEASSVATSRGRPTFTPASANDSRMMNANAGPLAERPVRANSRSLGRANFPLQMPVIPAPTEHGVLGMARTTGVSVCSALSITWVCTEAATEINSFFAFTTGRISSSTERITCGFTHSRITSAFSAAARLSVETLIPSDSLSARARSACATVPTTCLADTRRCAR